VPCCGAQLRQVDLSLLITCYEVINTRAVAAAALLAASRSSDSLWLGTRAAGGVGDRGSSTDSKAPIDIPRAGKQDTKNRLVIYKSVLTDLTQGP
jgi:hypothetical protein